MTAPSSGRRAGVRLIVVDQSLQDAVGHHLDYGVAVAEGAAGLGLRPTIVCHRGFRDVDAFGATTVTPWFSENSYEAHRGRLARSAHRVIAQSPAWCRGVLLRAAIAVRRMGGSSRGPVEAGPSSFGRELRAYLETADVARDDHVLIHTVSMPELHATLDAFVGSPPRPLIHVVLRRDAEEREIRSDPRGGAVEAFARVRRDPALAARLVFHTDSEPLRDQYRALSHGVDVGVLPIPFPRAAVVPDGPDRDRPLNVVYLGDARAEKGYHLLPSLLTGAGVVDGVRARLVAQSNSKLSLEEATIVTARRALASRPVEEVELVETALSVAAFDALVRRSDIVVLPYRRDRYVRRTSGVLVQALAAGKPVVVPARTWLADAAPSDAAVTFDEPDDFPGAVATAVARHDALSRAARSHAPWWRAHHSGENFVRHLTQAGLRRVDGASGLA